MKKLFSIGQLLQKYPNTKEGSYRIVYLPENNTAFSFFNYLFLPNTDNKLTIEERRCIKQHEQFHFQQGHSLDVLFIEIVQILLWFHPTIYWIKNSLKDLHEYLVDEAVIQQKMNKMTYAQLLLKLSSPLSINSLTTGFTDKQIGRRIKMLAKKPSAFYHKLKFLLMIPIIATLLLFSACFEDTNPVNAARDTSQTVKSIEQNAKEATLKIGTITWEGNTIFSDDALNEAFQLNAGDIFNQELLDKRLRWDGKGTDVSSLYFNKGYAYFNVEVDIMQNGYYVIDELPKGDYVIDLNFRVFEGVDVSIADIIFSGNETITETELMSKIDIKPGDLFSRSKIIAAQKTLAEMGKFDPLKIGISTPIVEGNNQLMNIEFSLVEIE